MKIQAKLSIGYPGAVRREEIEIPDDELEGLSPTDRDAHIESYVSDWAHEHMEWSWKEDRVKGL